MNGSMAAVQHRRGGEVKKEEKRAASVVSDFDACVDGLSPSDRCSTETIWLPHAILFLSLLHFSSSSRFLRSSSSKIRREGSSSPSRGFSYAAIVRSALTTMPAWSASWRTAGGGSVLVTCWPPAPLPESIDAQIGRELIVNLDR